MFRHLTRSLAPALAVLALAAGCGATPTPLPPPTVTPAPVAAATAPAPATATTAPAIPPSPTSAAATPASGGAAVASPTSGGLITVRIVVVPEQSEARYRVREQLASLQFPSDAVGATKSITGTIVGRSDGSIDAAQSKFTVDLRTDRKSVV